MANTSAAFMVEYTGPGVVNLGKAGTFQAGTKAWVDEAVAQIARTHADFVVTAPPMDVDRVVDEMPAPAPMIATPVVAAPAPVAAAPASVAAPAKPQRKTRATGAIKIPAMPDESEKK